MDEGFIWEEGKVFETSRKYKALSSQKNRNYNDSCEINYL